ncbi:MAG: Clp protease ClpP [Flavobacteriales bacterium]|nr:Clp protease ClpP [Flavobacteriales bacterium]
MDRHQQYNGFQLIMGEDAEPKEILIEGIISSWTPANSREFRKAFNLLAKGGRDVHVRIGYSQGGSMFEGNVMATMMRESTNKVITYLEGAAASMAGVIFVAGDERKISKLGMLMTHPPTGSPSGGADQLRSFADAMDKLEKSIVQLFVQQTGKDESTVRSWFKKGEDVWHDADECVANGLATEIVQGVTPPEELQNILHEDPSKVFEVFNQITTKTTSTDMKDLKIFMASIALMLGISQSSEQNQIEEKLKEVLGERDLFKNKFEAQELALKTERQAEAKALTDKMVEMGALPEHLRTMQMKAFEEDHEGTRTAVMAILAPEAGGSKSPAGADPANTSLPDPVAKFLSGLEIQNGKKPGKKAEEYTDAELEVIAQRDPKLFNQILDQIVQG